MLLLKRVSYHLATPHYLGLRGGSENIHHNNKRLLEMLRSTSNQGIRVTIAELFKISRSISQLELQLNSPSLEALYLALEERKYQMHLEGLNMFVTRPLRYNNKQFLLHLVVRGKPFEWRNDPETRKSLYFHEIKDLHKHLTITPLIPNPSQKMQQLHRSNLIKKVLDNDNPLGFPEVQIEEVQLKLSNNSRHIEGTLNYHLGKVRVMSLSISQEDVVPGREDGIPSRQSKRKMLSYYLSEGMSEKIKDFVEDVLPAEDIHSMIQLSKCTHQFGKIEQLKNLHTWICNDLMGDGDLKDMAHN